MLEISYEDSSNFIKLKLENNYNAWAEIRILCEEKSNANEIKYTSAYSLKIPWWRFLDIRKGLKYLIVKNKLKLDIDKKTAAFMNSALDKEKAYEKAKNIILVPYDQIVNRLKMSGFTGRELKDFQLRNVSKLASLTSAATFSVPGAGKTTEALSFYYLNRTNRSKLLIVAPKNAFPAWDEQIKECIENASNIERLVGGRDNIREKLSKNPEICIITYNQLPKVVDLVGEYLSNGETSIFVDESHRMKKGYNGIYGRSILSLAHIPKYKLILSGTPMPQNEKDLVGQFNFLYPEINVNEQTVISAIKPIYVRTTKKDLKLLKPVIEIKKVAMKPNQRRLYDLLISEVARQAESILQTRDKIRLRHMGKSVLRLIQLTSNPALLLKSELRDNKLLLDVLSEGDSAKLEYVCKRARQLASENKKVIIWSSFVENVELLATRLQDLGADFIHGGVDVGDEDDNSTREAKIKRFHDDDDAYVLIANPAAASEGISLHKVCHNAIYLDRNFNGAQFLQSMDRIHRVGLREDQATMIEIIMCQKTIDEKVNDRLEMKINRMSEILNDESLKYEYEYSDEEEINNDISESDIEDTLEYILKEVD